VRHVAGTADAPSLGDPVVRHRGFAPELAGKGGLVRMCLWVTVQVRLKLSHFLQALLDDLVGALRVGLTLLTSQFMGMAPANSTRSGLGITVSSSQKQSKTNQANKDCQLLEPLYDSSIAWRRGWRLLFRADETSL
jgi:hypothetical protein